MAALAAGLVLAAKDMPGLVWVMFLFAAQFVMVRWREQEFSAMQFGMLLMMTTWQSLWSILAVTVATMIYELVVLRVWYKALFNVVTGTATYGLAFAVFHAVDQPLVERFGEWGLPLAVLAAGVTQEVLTSLALWLPVRLRIREWLDQEKWALLSLLAASFWTATTLTWPYMLLLGLGVVVLIPILSDMAGRNPQEQKTGGTSGG